MAAIYFTIAGTNHWHGSDFLEPKMEVTLIKEPDNEVDKEAIKVEMPGIGQTGYVANSPYTTIPLRLTRWRPLHFKRKRYYKSIGKPLPEHWQNIIEMVICFFREGHLVYAEIL